ncbi:hypothetical protein SUGI_0910710 [Cryptomeria japonica]|nr:hypothetical protein SUGI_0910710 [Cryptomeria japonica]
MVATLEEAGELFARTGVTPQDIDIVIRFRFSGGHGERSIARKSRLLRSNPFHGNDRTFMLNNFLFRVGGAAMLRTNLAADDEAYDCVFLTEDNGGVYGVRLGASLYAVAAKAVANNLAVARAAVYYAYNWLSIKIFKMKLNDYDLEASSMLLFRFGNTSTSGVWYEMAYLKAKRRLKVGERALQIALVSGFKRNTVV